MFLSRIINFFWSDLSDQEIKKYGLLATTFFFIIGAYWLMRPLKDGIFFNLVGGKYQPIAKMISVVVVFVLVMIYSKLVDVLKKQNLFYLFGSIYVFIFLIGAYVIGLSTTGPNAINPTILRSLGWITYFVIESFGSLIVALFWSFTASVSDASTAKRTYPMILAGAQLGAIIGPFLAWHAKFFGLRLLFGFVILAVIVVMFLIRRFMSVVPKDQQEIASEEVKSEKKLKTGFLEGAKLLFTRSYLFGIFIVVTSYEVVATIIDYQMKMQAQALPEYSTTEALTSFLGIYGMATNILALLMVLLGTGYFMKKLGLRFCLLVFPITLGIAVTILYGIYNWGNIGPHSLLWFTFAVMMLAKGLNYALNSPAKEMMYIPTSKDAKFKTKGWIDMFGNRTSKAGGATINNVLKNSPHVLLAYGTIISLGLIGIWIVAAIFVSSKFNILTRENRIVE